MSFYKQGEICKNIINCNDFISRENLEELFNTTDINPDTNMNVIKNMFKIYSPVLNTSLLYYFTINNSFSEDIIKFCLEIDKIKKPLNNYESCPICLDKLEENLVTLKCNHTFHEFCLNQSLKINDCCPYCRAKINKSDKDNDYFTYLVNAIHYQHCISLIQYIIDKIPQCINFNYYNNYFDIYTQETVDLNLINVINDAKRLDVLLYLIGKEKYNVSTLVMFVDSNYLSIVKSITLNETINNNLSIINEYFKHQLDFNSFGIYTSPIKDWNISIIKFLKYFQTNYNFDMKNFLNSILNNSIGFYYDSEQKIISEVFIHLIYNYNNEKYKELLIELLCKDKQYISTDILLNIIKHYRSNIKTLNNNNFICKMKILIDFINEKYYHTHNINILISSFNNANVINSFSSIRGGLKILKKINKLQKIDFNLKDESNYIPLLDAAKYSCIDTFNYLLPKTNLNTVIDGCISEYEYHSIFTSVDLILASLLNSDNRIFNKIIANVKKFHRQFSKIDIESGRNIIKYFTSFTKLTKKQKYDKIVKLMYTIRHLDMKINFKDLYSMILCGLDSEYGYKFSKLKFYTSGYNVQMKNLSCDAYYLDKIELGSFNESWISNENINRQILNKYDTKTINIIYREYVTNVSCCDNIEKNISKYINLQINDFEIILKDLNTNYTILELHKRFIKLLINNNINKFDNKSTKFKNLIIWLSQKDNYWGDINTTFIKIQDFKLDCLILNGCPIEFKYDSNMSDNAVSWLNVKRILRKYIRKKFNKDYIIQTDKINIDEEVITPNLNYKVQNPIHITPLDYLKINNSNCLFTEKADGVTRRGFSDIIFKSSKKLFPEFKFKNFLIEAEYVKELDIYFVFDVITNNLDDKIKIYNYMRKTHDWVIDKEELTNINHSKFNKYLGKEFDSLSKYSKYLKNNNKIGWWPKKIWKFDKNSSLEDIEDIIIDNQNNFFKTDGWIVNNLDENIFLKIKPREHLTVDLKYDYAYKKWHTKNGLVPSDLISYDNVYRYQYSGKIVRCYWIDGMWVPREIRDDKKQANNEQIFLNLTNLNINYWDIGDIIEIRDKVNPYYNLNKTKVKNAKYIGIVEEYLKSNCIDNVLDIGCGFRKQLTNIWTSLDIDLNALKYIKKDVTSSYIWGDFTEKLIPHEQYKVLGESLYEYINNECDKKINYRCLLLLNCVHYAKKTPEKWNNLIFNINLKSRLGSKVIIRYLDKNKLLTLLNGDKEISNNNSFVKYNNNQIEIFYDWNHDNPKVEYLVEDNDFNVLLDNGWNICDIIEDNEFLEKDKWNNYFNCFKTIVFEKE